MSIVKLAPNVPARVTVKYLDAVAGKYGPQIRIKGQVDDDADAMLFLPGRAPDAIQALLDGGVVTEVPTTLPDAEGDKPLALTAARKTFTVVNKIAAGEKYGTLHVVDAPPTNGHGATTTPYTHPTPLETPRELTPASAPAQPGSALQQATRQYASVLTWALDHVVPKLGAADIPVDASAVNAIVATIIIQSGKL